MVEHAYASGTAEIFLVAAPLSLIALIAIALLPEVPLGTRSGTERLAEERAAAEGPAAAPPREAVPA